ncbi:MAG TPA: L,D-transpeptidase [Thiotrichales bacterium]|nr:L,D-transpeptidase [Thiotrichales bacterium]
MPDVLRRALLAFFLCPSLLMADMQTRTGAAVPGWPGVAATLERLYPGQRRMSGLVVSISQQRLYRLQDGRVLESWPVSTSRYGAGSEAGSYRTPLGLHRVRERIGADLPEGAIISGRIPTGEVAELVQEPRATDDDLVTSRILWLEGLEPGLNQGEGVDSHARYIYIHGTHEEGLIGQPASKGCIRMYNRDVIRLFDKTPSGTLVLILP